MSAARDQHDDAFIRCGLAGAPVRHCRVIDTHGHLGTTPGMALVDDGPDSHIRVMDRLGVDCMWVSSIPAMHGQAAHGNDQVLAAMQRYPGRFGGAMALDVGCADTIVPEMQRCHAAGLRAVKITDTGGTGGVPYNHPNYELVFDVAQDHHLPVLVHTWAGRLETLQPALERYGNIRWILAHAGSGNLSAYSDAAVRYEHVYLDTCYSACPHGVLEQLVARVPLAKILWGSDAGFLGQSAQLGRVLFADITAEQKRAILGKNAQRLFGTP